MLAQRTQVETLGNEVGGRDDTASWPTFHLQLIGLEISWIVTNATISMKAYSVGSVDKYSAVAALVPELRGA